MLRLILLLTVLVVVAGCRSSQPPGTCKQDTDCKEGVCVFGKCQECAADKDCSDGKTCQSNQCLQTQTLSDSTNGAGQNSTAASACTSTGVIYFDFNVYEIKDEGRDLLTSMAACMRLNSDARFMLAGNTDERGTVEYNLALGEKRAQAVSQYLQKSGIEASRLHVVSYGKEKPADPAHNEEAWAKNRRTDVTMD